MLAFSVEDVDRALQNYDSELRSRQMVEQIMMITTMKLKAIQLKFQQMNSLYTHQVHTAFQPAIRIK